MGAGQGASEGRVSQASGHSDEDGHILRLTAGHDGIDGHMPGGGVPMSNGQDSHGLIPFQVGIFQEGFNLLEGGRDDGRSIGPVHVREIGVDLIQRPEEYVIPDVAPAASDAHGTLV